jgi:NAD-dependent dihydropyrimidine dehydrogenase PreA subunit
MCAIVCPRGVFEIEDQPFFGLLRKAVVADQGACIECGACAINCPVNAIRVQTGAGCATGVLLGAIGKGGECCSSGCGVSPAVTGSSQTICCDTRTEDTKADSDTSS